jgi:3-deoxy-manno-octulosonate cytidylyltransferase (CMP-KDO synthetase)
MDQRGNAMYMSRQPIPTVLSSSRENFSHTSAFKQVCIIPFRRQTLLDFSKLPSTPLEKLESVDMLRLIEHGYRVKMVRTEFNTQAVDTQADLERVAILMKADSFVALY